MKINMYIVRDYLGDNVISGQITSSRSEGNLENIAIFEPRVTTEADTLYLVEMKHFQAFEGRNFEGSFIFLNGGISEPPDSFRNDYLIIQDRNMAKVLQNLQQLFKRFQDWELELYKAISMKSGLKVIALTAASLIENPLFLYTSAFKLVFCINMTEETENFFESLEEFDDPIEGEYASEVFLEMLKGDQERKRMLYQTEPEIYAGTKLGYRTMYYNIFFEGVYTARMIICEATRKLRDGDYLILKTLTDFIKPLLEKQDLSVNDHPKDFDRYLKKVIRGERPDARVLESVLNQYGYHTDDRYFCCYIPVEEDTLPNEMVISTCVFMEGACKTSVVLPFDNHLIHIVNLSAMETEHRDLTEQLARIYKERRLKAGCSMEFNGILQLYDRCRQAKAALEMGIRKDPEGVLFSYRDYVLSDLLNTITDCYSIDSIRPDSVRRLEEYDRANHMQLTKSLRVYLENDRNTARAIRSLYMQRATFLYQIRRIIEITGLDLDDYKTRLYLQLYFAIERRDEE